MHLRKIQAVRVKPAQGRMDIERHADHALPALEGTAEAADTPLVGSRSEIAAANCTGFSNRSWLTGLVVTTLSLLTWLPAPLGGQETTKDLDTSIRFSGDFRLRFEETDGDDPGNILFDSRQRLTLRFRAGFTKAVNEYISLGARLVTGDPGDPNTSDVTLGDFVDDLAVSLDRAYLQLQLGGLSATGGKIPNPFMRTDLVWDGDVNPEGVSARFTFPVAKGITSSLTAIFRTIDEQARTDIEDSKMVGGQVEVAFEPTRSVGLRFAGSYYDYEIKSLADADAGDTRSNYLATEDSFLSDFNLLNILATARFPGPHPRWPISLVGDYVKNLGINEAVREEDTGFSIDLFIGTASTQGDVRFRYGFSEAGTDAVLAAFSHDNTTIATNYRQHSVSAGFLGLKDTSFELTWYYYRKKRLVTIEDRKDWVSRLRLSASVQF